ncbi:MAG: hypothetical protein GC181_08685 [Bacteroidetes bacterium]|nr:hypothetical protein [Bacteroidota bacterium]
MQKEKCVSGSISIQFGLFSLTRHFIYFILFIVFNLIISSIPKALFATNTTSSPHFKNPEDSEIWAEADTIPGRVYAQSERDSIVLSIRQTKVMEAIRKMYPEATEQQVDSLYNRFYENFINRNSLLPEFPNQPTRKKDADPAMVLLVVGIIVFISMLWHFIPALVKRNASGIKVIDNEITIINSNEKRKELRRSLFNLETHGDFIDLLIYENEQLYRKARIQLQDYPEHRKGLFLHFEIRVNTNSSVQIEAAVSKSKHETKNALGTIVIQPFFLSDQQQMNDHFAGRGGFERGLHFRGIISGNMQMIAFCDVCKKSFSMRAFHMGFAEKGYAYSDDGKELLTLSHSKNSQLDNYLIRYANPIALTKSEIEYVDRELFGIEGGRFKYLNPLRCPHCREPYFDYKKFPEMRPGEYYAHYTRDMKITDSAL